MSSTNFLTLLLLKTNKISRSATERNYQKGKKKTRRNKPKYVLLIITEKIIDNISSGYSITTFVNAF